MNWLWETFYQFEEAKQILWIKENDRELTKIIILKHYRQKIREHHPDSNKFCWVKKCLDTIKTAKDSLIFALENLPIILDFDSTLEKWLGKIEEYKKQWEKPENIWIVVVIDLTSDLTWKIIEENIKDVDFMDFFSDYWTYWENEIKIAERLKIIQDLGEKYHINTKLFIGLIYTYYIKETMKMVVMREEENWMYSDKFYANIVKYYIEIGKEFNIQESEPLLLKAITDDYLWVHYSIQSKLQEILIAKGKKKSKKKLTGKVLI